MFRAMLSSYAEGDVLAKYMKRAKLTSGQYFDLSRIINDTVEMLLQGKPVYHFVSSILAVLKDLDPLAKQYCLASIKEYLHSRDFNCPNKYEKKFMTLWTLKLATYTYESKLLDPIYQALDQAIDTLKHEKPSSKTALEPQDSFLETLGKTIDTSCDYIVHNPGKTLVILLSLQASFAAGKVRKRKEQSVPAIHPTHEETSVVPLDAPCAPLDIIYEYYNVIANAPLEKVTHIGYLETHNVQKHHDAKKAVIPSIAEKGDIGLIEGIESMKMIPCKNLENTYGYDDSLPTDNLVCVGWDNEALVDNLLSASKIAETIPLLYQQTLAAHELLADELTTVLTKGIAKKHQLRKLMIALHQEVITLNEVLITHQFDAFNMNELSALRQQFAKACQVEPLNVDSLVDFANRIDKHLTKVFKAVQKSNALLNDYEIVVKERNRKAIETFKKLKEIHKKTDAMNKQQRRYHFISGMFHVMPERLLDNPPKTLTELSEMTKNDPQHELIEYFSQTKSAILIPKNK